MTLFGFTGPSRAGKTTLARRVAEELGIQFHATQTTKVANQIGIDPLAPMSIQERVKLQTHLLETHLLEVDQLPRPLVIDRTPVDYLAYLLCEIHMQAIPTLDPITTQLILSFKDQVMAAMKTRYDQLFILSSLPHYASEADKHAGNDAYLLHYRTVTAGIVAELLEKVNLCWLNTTDMEVRATAAHDQLVKRLDTIENQRRSAPYMN